MAASRADADRVICSPIAVCSAMPPPMCITVKLWPSLSLSLGHLCVRCSANHINSDLDGLFVVPTNPRARCILTQHIRSVNRRVQRSFVSWDHGAHPRVKDRNKSCPSPATTQRERVVSSSILGQVSGCYSMSRCRGCVGICVSALLVRPTLITCRVVSWHNSTWQ